MRLVGGHFLESLRKGDASMNICLVLISDGWGGAETVVYELARHLRDKGENVGIMDPYAYQSGTAC
ncbi:unnamed protein product [marine sediment metagenome]|uniref:Uncharacterized protein n=1 Tax=marine sediment metagenome TaxID=412755 RepID=X0TP69_9ZZZZ